MTHRWIFLQRSFEQQNVFCHSTLVNLRSLLFIESKFNQRIQISCLNDYRFNNRTGDEKQFCAYQFGCSLFQDSEMQKCRNFHWDFFFLKNPITKNQKPKKCHFPAPPILNIFLQKFQGLVLKKGVKTQKMHFNPFFEFTLDSLTTIQVQAHQCPSHQFILLT